VEDLVALLLEVEVVWDGDLGALADGAHVDDHLKLAPALLVDAEGRLLLGWFGGSVWRQSLERRGLALLGPLGTEGRVQLIHDLVEDGGGDGFAVVNDEEDFDAPFAGWELAVRHIEVGTGGF
jgi:hypothetical protein